MIEKIISDTIFHSIREILIADGWYPDAKSIPNYDSNDINLAKAAKVTFENQKNNIVDNKGFCIDLLGYSSNQYKDIKKVPRIVVDIHQFLPNDIGTDTKVYYEKAEIESTEVYLRKRTNPLLSDLDFTIYIEGINSNQIIVMNEIVNRAIPYKGYIKPLNEESLLPYNNYFVHLIDKGRSSELLEGIMERFFSYRITDIMEIPENILSDYISKITEIDLETKTEEVPNP